MYEFDDTNEITTGPEDFERRDLYKFSEGETIIGVYRRTRTHTFDRGEGPSKLIDMDDAERTGGPNRSGKLGNVSFFGKHDVCAKLAKVAENTPVKIIVGGIRDIGKGKKMQEFKVLLPRGVKPLDIPF